MDELSETEGKDLKLNENEDDRMQDVPITDD
jgi:hypothetical protein